MIERGHLDVVEWRAFFEQSTRETDREIMLDHIASCPQCAEVFKAARTAGLAAVETQIPGRSSNPMRVLIPIAAMLTIGIVSAIVIARNNTSLTPSTTPLAPSASAPVSTPREMLAKPPMVISAELLLATRGREDNTKYLEALADALRPYDQDNFASAITRLEPLAKDHPDRFEPVFYLGASLMMAGRSAEAVPILERAVTIVDTSRRDLAVSTLATARRSARP